MQEHIFDPNQHVQIISEGSCHWSNGCWKFGFAINKLFYLIYFTILKCNKIAVFKYFNYISQY